MYRTNEEFEADQPFKVLGPGAFFGEAGLFGFKKRLVTVVAKTTSELLELQHSDFQAILQQHSDIAVRLKALSKERRRSATQSQSLSAAAAAAARAWGSDRNLRGSGGEWKASVIAEENESELGSTSQAGSHAVNTGGLGEDGVERSGSGSGS